MYQLSLDTDRLYATFISLVAKDAVLKHELIQVESLSLFQLASPEVGERICSLARCGDVEQLSCYQLAGADMVSIFKLSQAILL